MCYQGLIWVLLVVWTGRWWVGVAATSGGWEGIYISEGGHVLYLQRTRGIANRILVQPCMETGTMDE